MAGIPHLIENASRSQGPLFLGLRTLGCRRQGDAKSSQNDPGRDHIVCLRQAQAVEGIDESEIRPNVVYVFAALLDAGFLDVA